MNYDHIKDLRRGFREVAISYMALRNPMYERMDRIHKDRVFQGLHNNLWDNHPGEIDRWRDDGGR